MYAQELILIDELESTPGMIEIEEEEVWFQVIGLADECDELVEVYLTCRIDF